MDIHVCLFSSPLNNIIVARTSSTVLNKSGGALPCYDLREKAFGISPLSMVLVVGVFVDVRCSL